MAFKTVMFAAGLTAGLAATAVLVQDVAPAAAETVGSSAPAAASGASSPEVAFLFNTLLFLIGGFLVWWMAAGFALLEAGLVRSRAVSMQ
ncbi:hypothetical protein [Jiella flava]|uniref:hypothetical protein n=1 Tax=Jiella flava TaxID=2816857 RepID=UPI003CCF5F39